MDGRKKVLIIDDDFYIRFVLKRTIASVIGKNSMFFDCADPMKALGYVFVHDLDLVIIDSTLPGMSGLEVVGFINENFARLNSPVSIILLHQNDEELPELDYKFVLFNKDHKEF